MNPFVRFFFKSLGVIGLLVGLFYLVIYLISSVWMMLVGIITVVVLGLYYVKREEDKLA